MGDRFPKPFSGGPRQHMSAAPQLQVPRSQASEVDWSGNESQSMEAIGRLVSGVAHDFNNLLTGIVLCSDLLLAGLDRDSRLRRYALEIRSAGAQGASLVQQLSAVVRPGTTEPTLLSFNEVVVDMRNLLSRLIGENIDLRMELEENLGCVKITPARARQIILNLALNARDAMAEGGQLTLSTRPSTIASDPHSVSANQPQIEFEVRDTGCGMDAQTQARIFEPFFTTKALGKGTGLGLSTVLNIVRQYRGTIDIESEQGAGTRVIVRFPAEASPIPEKGNPE